MNASPVCNELNCPDDLEKQDLKVIVKTDVALPEGLKIGLSPGKAFANAFNTGLTEDYPIFPCILEAKVSHSQFML